MNDPQFKPHGCLDALSILFAIAVVSLFLMSIIIPRICAIEQKVGITVTGRFGCGSNSLFAPEKPKN